MSKNGKTQWPVGFREKHGALQMNVTVDGKKYERAYKADDRSEAALVRARRAFQVEKETAAFRAPLVASPASKVVALPGVASSVAFVNLRTLGIAFTETLTGDRQRDVKNFFVRWCAATDDPALPVFGDRDPLTITSLAIEKVLAQWKRAKVAHWTRHHLRAALRQGYATVYGKKGYNPISDSGTKWKRPKDTDARGIPYDAITLILAEAPEYQWVDTKKGTHGPDSKAKIVLQLIALTGLTPKMLNGVRLRDLNLKARTVTVRDREKGEGAHVGTIRLLAEAVPVWQRFIDNDLFGTVRARSVARAFAAALGKARAKWATTHAYESFPVPERCRPYDLRHSFGTEMYRRTGDIAAVAALLGHAKGSPITQRYIQGAVDERAAQAVDTVSGSLFKRRA